MHPGVAKTFHAVRVVAFAFLGVAEHLIGRGALLELRFRFLVVRVLIRVVLDRHAPVGTFDLVLRGILLDPEDFVVIPFGHRQKKVCHRERLRPLWQTPHTSAIT